MNIRALEEALERSILETVREEPRIAVAYSGGLDSSIIAHLSSRIAKVQCYTCAVERSFDARNAERAATLEGLELSMILLNQNNLANLARDASNILHSNDPVRISYTIPIISVLHDCRETLVLTGSGADELFGGYAKYSSVKDPSSMMALDLEKLESEAELLGREAAVHGKRIGFPFISKNVVSLAAEIPLEEKIDASGRKILLRQLAKSLNLPSHDRPKKAAQYSSGSLASVRTLAKGKDMALNDYLQSIFRKVFGG